MNTRASGYRGFRFPGEIISHTVWLYHRFAMSLRDVDQDGGVIDILVQRYRNGRAAKRFFLVMPSVDHSTQRYANNLAEVSHQPTRQRERQMSAANYGLLRDRSFKEWSAATAY